MSPMRADVTIARTHIPRETPAPPSIALHTVAALHVALHIAVLKIPRATALCSSIRTLVTVVDPGRIRAGGRERAHTPGLARTRRPAVILIPTPVPSLVMKPTWNRALILAIIVILTTSLAGTPTHVNKSAPATRILHPPTRYLPSAITLRATVLPPSRSSFSSTTLFDQSSS